MAKSDKKETKPETTALPPKPPTKRWLVSWAHSWKDFGAATLYTPWWIGSRIECDYDNLTRVWAALKADSQMEVKEIIRNSFKRKPKEVPFLSIEEKGPTWEPYSPDRRELGWMRKYWERERYIDEK